MGSKGKRASWKHDQDGLIGASSTASRRHSPHTTSGNVDKRDFDANRPLLHRGEGSSGRSTRLGFLDDSDCDGEGGDNERGGGSLLSEVVDEIRERDRRKVRMNVVRTCSFIWGVMSCLCAGSITAFSLYGPLLLSRLHYTQLRVNSVAITAELGMYLPVPLFGYLCDRYNPAPISLMSGVLFGLGYLLAAFVYKSGPPADAGGDGWPFWVMILAFAGVGAGTASMYLAGVTTCAKNFGRGKYKGIMLAIPIAAFGLSGMWQSQVGTYLLYEKGPNGERGDVDVFRYFLFLGILLLVVGIGGTVGLRIVGEDELIDEAVEELERSGILDESQFFRSREEVRNAYGTFGADGDGDSGDEDALSLSDEERELEKQREEEERRKKNWLLNQETRLFLKDHTMWWLAVGFFLVTGPGEAYINNLGTVIGTLTPPSYPSHAPPPAGLPSTHVSTIAITSTIARLLTGSLSDFFAPTKDHHSYRQPNPEDPTSHHTATKKPRITFSRLYFYLPSALILSLGFLLLASNLPQEEPKLFHLSTALVGFGYGSAFSLTPIIISVVWGVENFGTNWGVVAMFPAAGAAVWGLVYSATYQGAVDRQFGEDAEGQCFGWECYGYWSLGCTVSVWAAIVIWGLAWRGWRKRGIVV
ncbi:putative monocarboxylate transporter mch1 [Arachnomyces sp. PD_36]|nr:putative monocarboxylate transporter mch1 [Arachnomyces sp. PD_36]